LRFMRVQLELPEARVEELKVLMEETGLDTYKDLFNNALSAFEWLTSEVKSGRVIAGLDEQNEKYRILVMPALERVAKTARKSEQAAATSR
jgi:hypothetical protein